MNLLSESTGSAVDTGIMYTAEHKHLVVGFVTKTAVLVDFVHSVLLLQ
jgi:hypothetical protein